MHRSVIAAIGVILMTSAPAPAELDHLQCYRISPAERVRADVDLTSALPELPSQAGCRVKGPNLFCGPVAKTIVRAEPPLAGAPPGPAATSYLCYKARCDQAPGTFQATDQFATYTLRSGKSFLLCAPAQVGSTTTTTTNPPSCGASAPTCGGSCPVGQVCVLLSFGPAGSGCGCTTPPVCAPDTSSVCGGNCPPACFCFTGTSTPCVCVCA